jgi:hypothetical protein
MSVIGRAAFLKRLADVEAKHKPPAPSFTFSSAGETDAEFGASLSEFTQGKPPNAVIHVVCLMFRANRPASSLH